MRPGRNIAPPKSTPPDVPFLVRTLVAGWSALPYTDDIRVTFSSSLLTSLGRCNPALARITLHPCLLAESRPRLPEVLCHELAHILVYRLFGVDAKPHGLEWQALVRAAGFDPSTSLVVQAPQRRPYPRRIRYAVLHACPVCHTTRHARRAVPRWRCAECVAAGLPGELVVSRIPSDA